jgi:hypothetical protein
MMYFMILSVAKWSWPNLRDCICISLEIFRKTTKEFSQTNWTPNQELMTGPPRYKVDVLIG